MASQSTPAPPPTTSSASPPVAPLTGSCLCGAIKYTINGPPVITQICHCMSCKKASGSAFMANSMYPMANITIHSSSTLKTYVDTTPESGNVLRRKFCGECGSNVFIENPRREGILVVMMGCVEWDGLKDWKADREVFCARRVEWLGGRAEEEKQHERGPV